LVRGADGRGRLASFGGAGGQHACEIARLLGIRTVLVHRHSSILSAYGLALADRVYERQQPASAALSATTRGELSARLDALEDEVRAELARQGFEPERVAVERALNMRFDGTDTALMVVPAPGDGDGAEDFGAAFRREYKAEFGFVLEGKAVVVDDVKVRAPSCARAAPALTTRQVRGTGRTFDSLGPSVFQELKTLARRPAPAGKIDMRYSVYFESGRVDDAPVYRLESLDVGEEVEGPAMVIDETQTIVLIPGAKAVVSSKHLVIEL
jgi:5-oxoprolinase (ATP-hydrolysing)